MTGVSSRTLRHYDAKGLLPPASVDGLEQWFAGVQRGSEHERRLREEAERRWGRTAVDAHTRTDAWTGDERDQDMRRSIDVHARIAELAAAGVPANDPRTLDAVADHHAWLRGHWEPSPAAPPAQPGRCGHGSGVSVRTGVSRSQASMSSTASP